MLCSILGSIWENFCRSCSFACNCPQTSNENTNNTEIVVMPDHMRMVTGPAGSSTNYLVGGTGEVATPNTMRTVRRLMERRSAANPELAEDNEEIKKISIYVKSFMKQLDCTMSEGWSRVETAAALCGINLRRRYRQESFTMEEALALDVKIAHIQKYGSGAAYLWELLKSNGLKYRADLEKLKDRNFITPGQLALFNERLPYCDLWTHESFSELELEHKEIFIAAAVNFGDDVLKKLNTKWTHGPGGSEKNIILEVENPGGHLDLSKLRTDTPQKSDDSDVKTSESDDSPKVDELIAGNSSPSPQVLWQAGGSKGAHPKKSSGLSQVSVRSHNLASSQTTSHENSPSLDVYEKKEGTLPQSAPPERSPQRLAAERVSRGPVSKTEGLPMHHLRREKAVVHLERKTKSP